MTRSIWLVLQLLTLLTLSAPAQELWTWQNPLPEGNPLSDIPLHTGDTWVYWESPWNGLGVWDTVTYHAERDTLVGGKAYKFISGRSSRYGNSWVKLQRVDSTGDVYGINTSTGLEELGYRLSDTSRSWWCAGSHLRRFDSTGQIVAELVNGDIDAGYHEVQFNARNLANGLYFYRLRAGGHVRVRSLVVPK